MGWVTSSETRALGIIFLLLAILLLALWSFYDVEENAFCKEDDCRWGQSAISSIITLFIWWLTGAIVYYLIISAQYRTETVIEIVKWTSTAVGITHAFIIDKIKYRNLLKSKNISS